MHQSGVFSAVSIERLAALGNDVVPELLRCVEIRANTAGTSFASEARHLPTGWRHVILVARMVEDIDEAGSLAGAFLEVRLRRDVEDAMAFLTLSVRARSCLR